MSSEAVHPSLIVAAAVVRLVRRLSLVRNGSLARSLLALAAAALVVAVHLSLHGDTTMCFSPFRSLPN